MERNFDLKEVIKSGVSPEQILADFQIQLADAQAEIAKEQDAAIIKIDEAREDMVNAIITYVRVAGLIPVEIIDADEMKKIITSAVKDAEKELAATKPLLSLFREMRTKETRKKHNPDDVIEEFLKSLK